MNQPIKYFRGVPYQVITTENGIKYLKNGELFNILDICGKPTKKKIYSRNYSNSTRFGLSNHLRKRFSSPGIALKALPGSGTIVAPSEARCELRQVRGCTEGFVSIGQIIRSESYLLNLRTRFNNYDLTK